MSFFMIVFAVGFLLSCGFLLLLSLDEDGAFPTGLFTGGMKFGLIVMVCAVVGMIV